MKTETPQVNHPSDIDRSGQAVYRYCQQNYTQPSISIMNTDFWDFAFKAVGALVALSAAIAGAIRFFNEQERNRIVRREELAWRKAEFLFRVSDQLVTNEEYRRAILMIDFASGLPQGSSLERVVQSDLMQLTDEERACRFTIDHYLDFFDRLYHLVFVLRVFTPKELEPFAWYIRRVGHCAPLAAYARTHGYSDILTLCETFPPQYGQVPAQSSS